ncbi:MAG: DUF4241 domain-containing protein [Paracoccaceae bacterium]
MRPRAGCAGALAPGLSLTLGLSLAAAALPASAQDGAAGRPGALDWMAAQTALPLNFHVVGTLDLAEGGVIAVDPLMYDPAVDWPAIPAPAGLAYLVVALDDESQRISKALLVFSDAAPVCGHDETTLGVDTGLAAFLDPPRAAALAADGAALAAAGKDIYNDWFDAQIGQTHVVAHLLPLPSGTEIPIVSSGWGDGGYPVASLADDQGRMVALYADFMGKDDEGTWLLPVECPAQVTEVGQFPPGMTAKAPSNL